MMKTYRFVAAFDADNPNFGDPFEDQVCVDVVLRSSSAKSIDEVWAKVQLQLNVQFGGSWVCSEGVKRDTFELTNPPA